MMIRINSIDQIQEELSRIRDLEESYITNLFLDPEKHNLWIKKGILYLDSGDESVFFFKKNDTFFNVYFCSSGRENLRRDISVLNKKYTGNIFVFDIIGADTNVEQTNKLFIENGYNTYVTLTRMSRLINSDEELIDNKSIRYANMSDHSEIYKLLHEFFDEYAEQLPLDEELKSWIDNAHLLLYVENGQIIGFTIFDLIGMTSYLRYWFVHPGHRNKKIGSSLLRRFFYEGSKIKRQLFWVIESNENAIMRYEHYGFKKETLKDHVFININKKYEDKSNYYSE